MSSVRWLACCVPLFTQARAAPLSHGGPCWPEVDRGPGGAERILVEEFVDGWTVTPDAEEEATRWKVHVRRAEYVDDDFWSFWFTCADLPLLHVGPVRICLL